ncbi:MAG: hypothetical protein ABFS30_02620 [Pseudomonadota bacterium]
MNANGKRRAVISPGVPYKVKVLKNEVIKDEYNRDGVNNAPGDDYGIGDIFLF